jgi:SAM-dependent methyltransferase
MNAMHSDDLWLLPWIPLLKQHYQETPLLELGCGSGADTLTLTRAGFKVNALDISEQAIAAAKLHAPLAHYSHQSILDPFPAALHHYDIVIASLSLHYFDWHTTEAVVERIRKTLAPTGILLCRLNSTKDQHFGAIGYPQIEPNFFLVDGAPKRFFDETSVRKLFSNGWRIASIEEKCSEKYHLPKVLWELVLHRTNSC